MRKIYCRRLFFSSFILSILSMCFLAFTTIYHHTTTRVMTIDSTPVNCYESTKASTVQLSTIPFQYIVVPYKDFALRTSIACRIMRLDNPRKDLQSFHPKYSSYLRGSFPYVIPYENITFDDIENFYTKILVNKKSNNLIINTSFASNISFENIPYKFQDGLWYPANVISAQRTAILVPLQGRQYNAKAFLLNMHAFLRRQQLTYTILIIEQVLPKVQRFNKGRLFNTAIQYIEKQSLNITCLILHDVDLIPEHDGNFYTCETKHPKHTTSRVKQLNSTNDYVRYYEFLIGGVLMLTIDMYKNLNGFSNLYWGWGGEDDDLALRFIQKKMCVVRPSYELAVYVGFPHPRGSRNSARYGLLTWSTIRLSADGYAQVENLTNIVSIEQTSVVTHLKVDVNYNGNLIKTSTLNSKNIHRTSTNKNLQKPRKSSKLK